MKPSLIELVDHNLSVRDAQGVIARSPGFASIAGKEPVFGETARQQARLQPRHTLNQFWSQLSLDPLPIRNPHFRHSADLAHGHLRSLTAELALDEGSILAVPSNYTRNQLAVLLGVVKQTSFMPVGLVDQALLLAASTPADECIVIDLQLHQAVLTRFRRVDDMLVKDAVVQVPATGVLALQDAWTNMITDEFLRQSRFDPKHNAETEQYLYNQLDEWIARSRELPELLVDINHKGSQFQARLTLEQFITRGSAVFRRIRKELEPLRTKDTALHIRGSLLHLPGLTDAIDGLIAVDDDLQLEHSLRHLDHIRRPADGLQFITRLPLLSAAPGGVATPLRRLPTHALLDSKAVALSAGRTGFGAPSEGLARLVPLVASEFTGTVVLDRQPRSLVLELHTDAPVLLNGEAASSGMTLALGDTLLLGSSRKPLQLIQVE